MTDFAWTDLEVRRALGLRTDLATEDTSFSEISTDTRTLRPGALYVALVGDRFDGHDYVADAVAGGAAGVVVVRSVPGAREVKVYPVTDTLVALGALAAHRRRALDCPVVAITGSTGKTTTKDLLAAALGSTHRTHATRGNKNNRVGVPLTLLETPADAEAVVLELGTNEPGEIRALTAIAQPDVAIITNVGESHLEKLGSVAGVMEEKLDLLRRHGAGARAVVGDEPPELATAARHFRPDVKVAGWSERADEDARPAHPEADAFGRYRFHWRGVPVAMPLPGRHAVSNAVLALTVAGLLGIPIADAVRGLENAKTGDLRGQMRTIGGLTVIVDCYNANPPSVRASLRLLEAYEASSRKVAILGTMLELGAESVRLHEEVLEFALAREVDLVVATGGFADAAGRVAAAGDDRVITAMDWREAYPSLKERLAGDEVVLLKASRGITLEGMLPLLEADYAADDTTGVMG